MKSIRLIALTVSLLAASCGGGSSSTDCTQYAAEVHGMIESGASAEELNAFVDETEEHVARMIADDPDRAGPCADAIFEAVFTGAFDEFAEMLDG
ncbi:MAG: hypothetical protein QNL12_02405 [Acidimicrobiia bacterium]|nr:hypothetical protein [Acidimicrobiia bacterium]